MPPALRHHHHTMFEPNSNAAPTSTPARNSRLAEVAVDHIQQHLIQKCPTLFTKARLALPAWLWLLNGRYP